MDNKQRLFEVSGKDYLKIADVAKTILESGVSATPPQLVIFSGGVAAGKTTIRRQKYSQGYVNFDFGEIYIALKKAFSETDSKLLTQYASIASKMILEESLSKKKNIVIEIIGEIDGLIEPVIDAMTKIGYKANLTFIQCDPVEAYKRHLKAASEDPDYISAAFTQEMTVREFYDHFSLGEIPSSPLKP